MEHHKTFCPMPGINAGMLTLEDLERVTELARKYNVPLIKITGGQRLFLKGLDPEQLQALKQELGVPPTPPHARNRINYVQACPGKAWCNCGVGPTEDVTKALMALELDGPLPAKVKVGISGCVRCCCESWMRDIGLTAEKKGWRLSFGGNAAGKPRIGNELARGLDDAEAIALVRKVLDYYRSEAKPKMRTARFVEQVGIEVIQQNVLE